MTEAQTPVPSCRLCCQEIAAQQMGGSKQLGGNNNIYSMNVNESPTLNKVAVCWHQYNATTQWLLHQFQIWSGEAKLAQVNLSVHAEMSLGFNILLAGGTLQVQGPESHQLYSWFFLISILGPSVAQNVSWPKGDQDFVHQLKQISEGLCDLSTFLVWCIRPVRSVLLSGHLPY